MTEQRSKEGEVVGRAAKHNWPKLYREFNLGRYKNMKQFAEATGLNYDQVKKEFKKLKDRAQDLGEDKKAPLEKGQKGVQKRGENSHPGDKGRNPHPWEKLKKQFLDWPEDKLQAYLVQLESRLAELKALEKDIGFENMPPEEQKEYGQLRRERRAILSDPDPEAMCRARKHDGSPCNNPVERGKKVCWNHGGAPGAGGPNNLVHGLYAKILPDCDEFKEIVSDIEQADPFDIVWHDIVMLQAQISWSHRIMFVTAKDEMIKELRKKKVELGPNPGYNPEHPGSKSLEETYREEEWEFQFAWDRQATLLNAQAKAMQALDKLIIRYESLIENSEHKGMVVEEHRLKLDKLRAEISKLNGPDDDDTLDGLARAIKESREQAAGGS
ncbi:MAG: hypothetical protein MJA84_07260 [Firmicutes bacterium]|nr:hypothetical protein [Bacillota bacterium]